MTPEIPEGWTEIKISSIFTPLSEKDGNREMNDYSCTNEGIFPRDQRAFRVAGVLDAECGRECELVAG